MIEKVFVYNIGKMMMRRKWSTIIICFLLYSVVLSFYYNVITIIGMCVYAVCMYTFLPYDKYNVKIFCKYYMHIHKTVELIKTPGL